MMNKTYYLSVSYKAKSKTRLAVTCEGNALFTMTEPFTYDDLMDILKSCVKQIEEDEWGNPTILSMSELSEGLFKQLSKRRK